MPENNDQSRPYSEADVVTIAEMARRLRMRAYDAYNLIETPGFPLYNLGGDRKNRVIWGDVLNWLRKNKSA